MSVHVWSREEGDDERILMYDDDEETLHLGTIRTHGETGGNLIVDVGEDDLCLAVGDRVTLVENLDEEWPAEEATILSFIAREKGPVITVEVPAHDRHDDGIREVTVDQIEGKVKS